MKVILAKNSGFCMGVRRAVETAKKIYGQGVYILGEIIHNESVTDEIKRLGTKIIDSPDEVDNGTVIIRSHGVGKDVYDKLEAKGIKIIDCPCPFVLKIHNIVKKQSDDSIVLIAGDKNHPEVKGIRSYCKGQSFVFKNEEELLEIINSNDL